MLTIKKENGLIYYKIDKSNNTEKNSNTNPERVNATLYRAVILLPQRWRETARILSQHDDIVLGVDTNILYDCTISENLLPALSLIEFREYVHTPNWILLVVPATVMYELEESANIRDQEGSLRYEGRMGYRAVQEIIELSNNIDIPGLSLLIVGEADPVLDNKASLRRINENIYKLGMLNEGFKGQPSRKTSSGDMTIRNQFKPLFASPGFS